VGQTGEVVIRGANVTGAYESNPEANERSFTRGWFRTGDEGYIDADGYLYLTDRIKEIINRGGEKVSPREVDEVLMDHPAVQQAVTFAVPHPQLGEDVVAAVVLRAGALATDAELRGFAAARLADHKAPRLVLVVDEFPKGPTGKLQRMKLSELLAERLEARYVAPRDEVERKLATLWAELLSVEQVGIHDNFFLLGGSSLPAAQMLARVEKAFGVAVPLDDFFRRSTLADLADAVRRCSVYAAQNGDVLPALARGPTVVPLQPQGSRPPLFMVGMGLGWDLRDVVNYLGPDQPVYGLRPTALLKAQPAAWGAEGIAAHYVGAIRTVRPHGPYVLGGGCAAGLVAFEMAQQLRTLREDVPLMMLFYVDYPPAGLLPTPVAIKLLRLPREWARLKRLTAREWWTYLVGRVRRHWTRLTRAVRPRHSAPDLQKTLWRLRDSAWTYRPRPYAGRIALMLSRESGVWFDRDRRLDWHGIAAGGCEVHVIPGDHNGVLVEPHAAAAAQAIRIAINCAMAARREEPRDGRGAAS